MRSVVTTNSLKPQATAKKIDFQSCLQKNNIENEINKIETCFIYNPAIKKIDKYNMKNKKIQQCEKTKLNPEYHQQAKFTQ